ncbi:hypothetical protein PESP_b0253 [Pseudoalteromonas espejiana DSM 9414]|uniref:Uncharacterized protein n=1 Tax=Pseudoalteromonas espejiana TaxID=28107 RepID=A0A510XUJ3_9GAMM|nr:hypothetical protein [Pseudoalteromonas espejiana]ASM51843.1 hypothetical protein PESP_b0253 [Pseudoalteromonas espejiana DSM 9414]GEK54683.1 hypothetical protein PES01_15280 [Pseudoalteromonas espejiana]
MAVENLQDLAKEIVENGVSLSAIHYVYITLVALVSAALGAYFGSYLKKRGEEQALKDSFDDVIDRLERTTRLTEEIKYAIGIGTIEHQIKFSKLHEKRIEVIEGLYHRLVNMESKGKDFVYSSGPTHELGSQFDAASKAVDEFISYSKLNKFWMDKALFDEIESIALSLDSMIHGAAFNCGVSPANTAQFTQSMEELQKIVKIMDKGIQSAKEKVIESIRKTLEPDEN